MCDFHTCRYMDETMCVCVWVCVWWTRKNPMWTNERTNEWVSNLVYVLYTVHTDTYSKPYHHIRYCIAQYWTTVSQYSIASQLFSFIHVCSTPISKIYTHIHVLSVHIHIFIRVFRNYHWDFVVIHITIHKHVSVCSGNSRRKNSVFFSLFPFIFIPKCIFCCCWFSSYATCVYIFRMYLSISQEHK